MTSPEPLQAEDGNLPAAKTRLGDALANLLEPKPQMVEDDIHWVESLYRQLVQQIPGSQGEGHGIQCSSPPLNIDATELKHEIDTAVAAWEPRPLIVDDEHMTIIRLRSLEKRAWRPQDVKGIEQIAGNVESWCESIHALLDPPPRWHLPNPCPACDKAIVYRKNSAGELVRQAALQLTSDGGCECQACHYSWEPYRIRILAAALGYPLPPGVLE